MTTGDCSRWKKYDPSRLHMTKQKGTPWRTLHRCGPHFLFYFHKICPLNATGLLISSYTYMYQHKCYNDNWPLRFNIFPLISHVRR